jgi:hypothetical protein
VQFGERLQERQIGNGPALDEEEPSVAIFDDELEFCGKFKILMEKKFIFK